MCNAGSCEGGEDVLFGAACDWFAVGESEPGGDVNLRDRYSTEVTGDICLDQAKIGQSSIITGNIVATNATGSDGVKIAENVIITGDIVTGGAGIKGTKGVPLPHLTPVTEAIPGGQVVTKDDPPAGVYDTTGTSALLTECQEALSAIDAAKAPLDALAAHQTNGRVRIASGGTRTITPTNVGGTNVVAFERLQSGPGATLELSGGGDPDTVMIIRVDNKFSLRGRCFISLTDGLLASNVLFYGRGKKVQFGTGCEVYGSVYGLGKVKLGNAIIIDGQVFGRKGKIKLGARMVGTLVPNQIVLP